MVTALWGLTALCLAGQSVYSASDIVAVYDVVARDGGRSVVAGQRVSLTGKDLWSTSDKPHVVVSSDDDVRRPVVCSDGAGGFLVAMEYTFQSGDHKGDTDVVVQHMDATGKTTWDTPRAVGASKSSETRPVIMADGAGGAYVVYLWKGEGSDTDLLVQRVNADGKCLWEKPTVIAGSKSVETNASVVPDGTGGLLCIYEWQDSGDIDVMVQRVDAAGKAIFNNGDKGIDVAASDSIERSPVAIADGRGGAIVAFEFEPRTGEHKGDCDIRAQHVGSDGKLAWGGGTPRDVGTSVHREAHPTIIPDGEGGAFVAFECEYTSGEYNGDIDVLAQHIDRVGEMVWNKGEKSQVVGSATGLERHPSLVADGTGGLIVVFENEIRTGEHKGDVNIFAQRLSGTGQMLWNEGKSSASVSTSSWHEQGPLALPDGAGGVVVVFTMTGTVAPDAGDQDLAIMRLGPDGKMLWESGDHAVNIADSQKQEAHPAVIRASDR